MHKPILFIPALFALIAIIGLAILFARDDNKGIEPTDVDELSVVSGFDEMSRRQEYARNDRSESGQFQVLEDKIVELELRIVELEQALEVKADVSTGALPSEVNTRDSRFNRTLTIKSLVKAGLSEDMAAEIVRRRNDIELRKLELNDRATREGYKGTPRYMHELTTLVEEQLTLREELGDAAYDEYLYANGQPNRVKVSSVMLGSTAEEAGMKDGDLILTYGDKRIYEGVELKNATGEGELGDYVNVDISRDGQFMSLWVPRGPLGVRLGIARVKP